MSAPHHKVPDFLRKLAFPSPLRLLVAFQALVFVLNRIQPGFMDYLTLSPDAIMAGEVWRLITFLFVPRTQSFLFMIIILMVLWFIGDALEQAWGTVRLNLYIVAGWLGNLAAAFFFGLPIQTAASELLYTSFFLAFATLYGEQVFYVFFILPLKAKYIAWMIGALLLLQWIAQPAWVLRVGMVLALSNYFVFFAPSMWQNWRHRQKVSVRRERFRKEQLPEEETLHRCATCHRTENDGPHLEFRVSRDGVEYCLEHLPSD